MRKLILWLTPYIRSMWRKGSVSPKLTSALLSVLLTSIVLGMVWASVLGMTYLTAFIWHVIKCWSW